MYGGFQLEHVIANGQVVLQPKGGKDYAVPDGEGQPEFVIFCNTNFRDRGTRPVEGLTLTGDGGFHLVEIWFDVGVGTDVGGHAAGGGERRRGVPRYGAVLVVHVVPHGHVLLELAGIAVLPVHVSIDVLRIVGELVHGTVRKVLALIGVGRRRLPQRPRPPHHRPHPPRSEVPAGTERLLRRVLVEGRLSRPVGGVLAVGVEIGVHVGVHRGAGTVAGVRLLAPFLRYVHRGGGVGGHPSRIHRVVGRSRTLHAHLGTHRSGHVAHHGVVHVAHSHVGHVRHGVHGVHAVHAAHAVHGHHPLLITLRILLAVELTVVLECHHAGGGGGRCCRSRYHRSR